MDREADIRVIGAGLAGSEAAWQLARRGIAVELCEMRPARPTPAHQTADFAELVCSNSLKSDSEFTAPWLLKEEMRRAGSLLLEIARRVAVPPLDIPPLAHTHPSPPRGEGVSRDEGVSYSSRPNLPRRRYAIANTSSMTNPVTDSASAGSVMCGNQSTKPPDGGPTRNGCEPRLEAPPPPR